MNGQQRVRRMFDKVLDSGERSEFSTGAHRDSSSGKGRYDLISPIALQRLARHYENGAVRYGDRNWEKGIPLHSYFDSAVRHLYKWLLNKLLGREQDEDHLSAAIWNIMCIVHIRAYRGTYTARCTAG